MSYDAFKNFILAEWTEPNDLTQLKTNLRNFPKCKIDGEELSIWEEPPIENQHKLDNLNYVKLGTKNEWEDEIQTLHLNIVDGFNKDTIKIIARNMECYENCGSLKLLDNCLNKLKDIPSSEVKQIMAPLFELNYYRSKVISHTTGEKYPDENLQVNFKKLIMNLNTSFSFLRNIIKAGFFDFKKEEKSFN